MKIATKLGLSSVCIFGAIAFSNEINNVDTSYLNAIVIAIIYQAFLAVVGGIAYVVGTSSGFIQPKAEITPKQLEDEQGFDIKEIITEGQKVVGKFGGKDIHEQVKVIFNNGFETFYRFDNTIKYDNPDKLDVSGLTPGSLILEPGIVYVPIK